MTIGPSTLAQTTAPVAHLAEQLADALEGRGDQTGAERALDLAARHAPGDPALALRRAERALAKGDAATAMRPLVDAWEAGTDDPRVESSLALCALVLGLDDIAQALTEPPFASLDHALIRLVLATARGESLDLKGDWRAPELRWGLRTLLRQLDGCGRTDLVFRLRNAAPSLAVAGLAEALAHVDGATPPSRANVSPPLDRDAFRASWRWPAADAVFSWAWNVAREVAEGERLLTLTPQPAPIRALAPHARQIAIAPGAEPGADLVAEPDALPLSAHRFDHVLAMFWLHRALDPVAALREMARTLTHGGQLHLLAVGPRLEDGPGFDLRLSAHGLARRLERAGFEIAGLATRAADGMPVVAEEAEVHLVRATRRVI